MPGLNVHIYPGPFLVETRIRKITSSLARAGVFDHVVVMGTWEDGLPLQETFAPNCEVRRLRTRAQGSGGHPLRKIAGRLEWSSQVLRNLRGEQVACVNCHSLPSLPVCVLLKLLKGSKLVYDTHELDTETAVDVGIRKIAAKVVLRTLMRFVDEVVAVSGSIAEWYEAAYGLDKVWVLYNFPPRTKKPVDRTTVLRDEFRVPDDALLFLYQGGVFENRGIRFILEVFSRRPHLHLGIMGHGDLVSLVKQLAASHPNIHYRPPVPPEEILRYSASADVGLSLHNGPGLSYQFALPNKLFEFVQAGLPVIGSDFPEQGRFIDQHNCGWKIRPDAQSLGALLDRLDAEAIASKRANALAASETFGWEDQEPMLLNIYARLFGHRSPEAPASPAGVSDI